MVKTLSVLALLCLVSLPTRAEESALLATEIRMEFSKLQVYEGEQVVVNFMLHSPLEILEVEVAKFPEFRGFLKDNLILRQGILATSGNHRGYGTQPGTAVIGSYSLIPIVGSDSYSIEPMKLVVKTPGLRRIEGSQPPRVVYSNGAEVVVQRLPAFPEGKFALPFSGLVGRLTALTNDAIVPFRMGEPTVLRTTVQGSANFAEVHQLSIPFPAATEVLSQTAHQQQNGSFGVKTFEVSLLPKQEQDFEMPPVSLVYFDPDLKNYRLLQGNESIKFQREVAPQADTVAVPRADIVLMERANVPFFTMASPNVLYVVNGLVVFLALGMGLSAKTQHKLRHRRRHSLKPHKEKFGTLAALRSTNSPAFLKLAEEYLLEDLSLKTKTESSGKTRKRFLDRASTKLGPEQKARIQWLLAECDRGRFAPPGQRSVDTAKLFDELSRLSVRK